MVVDKLTPTDPRVERKTALLNGRTYGYLLGNPQGQKRGTIFLIHGFPDISFGWRYQIPMLLEMGLRVVAPDCMGYGRTDAPQFMLRDYTIKRCADDMKELATQLGEPQIIIAGHDWGGAIVYRIALHHPSLVSHVISVCTAYTPPEPKYTPLQFLVYRLPQLGYQLHLASGEIEEHVNTPQQIRNLLMTVYGGRSPSGKWGFDPKTGVIFEELEGVKPSPLLNEEEMEYYATEYSRHGFHGPCNWYRTKELRYIDDLELFTSSAIPTRENMNPNPKPKDIQCPVLFIGATKEQVLTPEMAKKMPEQIPNLTMKTVDTQHWALWEDPEGVNRLMAEWIESTAFGGGSKL